MIDISILVPSVRTCNLPNVYKTIEQNIGGYSFEMVVVSPFVLEHTIATNCKFIHDLGSPNRAMQIAGYMAEGNLIMNCADDATFYGNGLKRCIEQYYNTEATRYDYVIAVKYTEDYRVRDDRYWNTHFHDDLRLPTIPNTTFSAVHMCSRNYWNELGGYDCSYQNPNFSTIEFMMRAIADGAKVELSEDNVYDVHWTQGASEEIRKPVHYSTLEEDIPLFRERAGMFKNLDIRIPVDNWKQSPRVWKRRWTN